MAGQTGLFQSEGSTSAAVRPFSGALATEMPKEEGDPRVAVDRLSGRPHKARREVIYAAANCPRRAGAPWRPVGGRSEGRWAESEMQRSDADGLMALDRLDRILDRKKGKERMWGERRNMEKKQRRSREEAKKQRSKEAKRNCCSPDRTRKQGQ